MSTRTSDHRIAATPQELARAVLGVPVKRDPPSAKVMAEEQLVERPGIEPGRGKL